MKISVQISFSKDDRSPLLSDWFYSCKPRKINGKMLKCREHGRSLSAIHRKNVLFYPERDAHLTTVIAVYASILQRSNLIQINLFGQILNRMALQINCDSSKMLGDKFWILYLYSVLKKSQDAPICAELKCEWMGCVSFCRISQRLRWQLEKQF